jgi:sporulation protein YunB
VKPQVVKRKGKKRLIATAIFLLIFFLAYFYLFTIVRPLVTDIAETRARAETMNSINDAAQKIKNFAAFHENFYNYEKNSAGEVVLVTANTAAINQLYILAQTEIQRSLNALNNSVIAVPLGAFTGFAVLSAFGPDIQVFYNAVGTAEAVWSSFFYSEGINQTIHRVILRVQTRVAILIPLRATDIYISTDIVIAENLIIGRVPEIYFNTGGGRGNLFNLIP